MRKIMLSLLSVIIISTIMTGAVIPASSADVDTAETSAAEYGETFNEDTVNGNSYNYYNSPSRNYLRATDSGYMRLYGCDDGRLLVENYDSDFNYINNFYVSSGLLPIFGGFYESDSYYFVVTGRNNSAESDDAEVIRVTRFNKSWGSPIYASIRAINTTVPFDAGGCDFAAYGENLFVRTAHEMYADANNIHHQSNLTIVINMNNLNLRCYGQAAHISSMGYLSHSFNQFVATDTDGTIVCLDHGDGHPRTVALGRFIAKADKNTLYNGVFDRNRVTYQYTTIIDITGRLGDNITGVMVGGLEVSGTHYLTVGASVEQNDSYQTNAAFNAYISATDKSVDNLGNATSKITYLTSFTEADKRYASNPQLVKITNDRFLVMWNEMPVFTYHDDYYDVERYLVTGFNRTYDENYVMKYVFVNGKGELVSDIMTAPHETRAYVSGCEPIVHNNKVIWYVSDGDEFANIVYMDFNGNITVRENIIPENIIAYPIDLSKVHIAFRDPENGIPSNVQLTGSNIDQYVLVHYKGKALEYGKDYTITGLGYGPMSNGIVRLALQLSPVSGRSFLPAFYSYNWFAYRYYYFINDAYRDLEGVHLDIAAYQGVGYHIYRRELGTGSTAFELVGTVNDRIQESFTDTTADYSKAYLYAIREFTYDANGNEVVNALSNTFSVSELPYVPTQVLLGDTDSDGVVTIIDATEIQRALAGLTAFFNIDSDAADVDNSKDVEMTDATAIQRYLAGLENPYGIDELVYPQLR